MGQEFSDPTVRLAGQASQDVLQVGEGLMALQTCGLDETHDGGRALSGAQTPGEQPVLATNRQFPFILPISGRKLKSIIDGIRCMGAASRFATSNSVAEAT